ncbi:hypothetical protein RCL1_003918 [Eukaryota sp. TZLM3-RCL]
MQPPSLNLLNLRKFNLFVDQTTPFIRSRWLVFIFFLFLFATRVIVHDAFYIIAYALAIFLLLTGITFLTPKSGLPSEEGRLPLHQSEEEEFRPFIRKLPEFKTWKQSFTATIISLFCTFLPFLDLPVYVPILVIYFCAISFVMLRVQVTNWIKYRYVPWNVGKKSYSKTRHGHSQKIGVAPPTIILPDY